MKSGFSLVEILLSLLILSGTMASLLQGIEIAQELDRQSKFEESAAFYAERELELLKSDLLAARVKAGPFDKPGRFLLPRGWKSKIFWSAPGETRVVRLMSQIVQSSQTLKLESFFYVPEKS